MLSNERIFILVKKKKTKKKKQEVFLSSKNWTIVYFLKEANQINEFARLKLGTTKKAILHTINKVPKVN